MNRSEILGVDRSQAIHRTTDDVQNSAETFFADRNGNRCAGILGVHPAHKTVGDIHGDATDNVVTQMLRDFNNQVIFLIVDRGVGNQKRIQNAGQFPFFESHVNNGTNNLNNLSDIHNYLLANSRNVYFLRAFPPPQNHPFANASVPPTISISSAVIAA